MSVPYLVEETIVSCEDFPRKFPPSRFGKYLYLLLKLVGWTQEELAEASGVAKSRISNLLWKESKHPRPATIDRITQALETRALECSPLPKGWQFGLANAAFYPRPLFDVVLLALIEEYTAQFPEEMIPWQEPDWPEAAYQAMEETFTEMCRSTHRLRQRNWPVP